MADKNSMENFQVVSNGIREATVEAFEIQAKVEGRSVIRNDLGLYVDEREIDEAVRNYVDITSSHLVKLKSRLNTFVTINKLPSEILTYIISFASLPRKQIRHPYTSYTWVCRHWRSTLIQDPNLWRLVHFESKDSKMNPFISEFIQRSKLAPLDIVFTSESGRFMSTFEGLFVRISDRIRRVWFSNGHIAPLISGKTFPSLRAVQYNGDHHGFLALISTIVASEHLDTLHCTMITKVLPVDEREQLASIFDRIRNLHIEIEIEDDDPHTMQMTFSLLSNNAKLQNLCLTTDELDLTDGNTPIIFPKLQFLEFDDPSLMKHFWAPKLSSLVVHCDLATELMPEVFNFSSIRCLYIINSRPGLGYAGGSIVGLKEDAGSRALFLTKFDDILRHFEDSVNSRFAVGDFLSDPEFPHDCFRFDFMSEGGLDLALLSILPRMTSLTALYLLGQRRKTFFTKVVALVPSVQKVVIRYYRNLKDYFDSLRNTSLCPSLKHISFVTDNPKHPERNFGGSVGKLLTECLGSRQGIPDNQLEYISLEMSPPIPDKWLKRLQNLVATVVIESSSL